MGVMIVVCFDYANANFKTIPGISYDIERISGRCFSNNFNIKIFRDTDENEIIDTLKRGEFDALYFSGHGVHGGILFPSGYVIPIDDIIAPCPCPYPYLGTNAGKYRLFIFDCCDTRNNTLPYKLCDGKFRLTDPAKRIFRNQDILIITSSNRKQNSVATKKGSKFSKSFTECLSRGTTDLRKIKDEVTSKTSKHNQNMSVYSSRIDRLEIF